MGENNTARKPQSAGLSEAKRRSLADYDKEYIRIEDFVHNAECCPLGYSDIDYITLHKPNVWTKTDFVDLHQLPPGTFVHACGGHNEARYTIRINKDNLDIWQDLGGNGYKGSLDSIVSFGGEDFFLRGILKTKCMFIMPYFRFDYSRPPADSLIEIMEESYWSDAYEAIFVKK